jgi:hypothetical protein
MTTFEAWSVPAMIDRRGDQEEFKFLPVDNAQGVRWPWSATKTREWWVGEIKPHTKRGIADGLVQLARKGPPPRTHRLLVTYRPEGRSRVEILAAPGPTFRTWHRLGTAAFDWTQRVPLVQCPSCLGAQIEGIVHRVVGRHAPNIKPKPSASSTGWDLTTRELAPLVAEIDFLRELVAELTST